MDFGTGTLIAGSRMDHFRSSPSRYNIHARTLCLVVVRQAGLVGVTA
jgi:hypothetical protein